jgi:hypothetical protein
MNLHNHLSLNKLHIQNMVSAGMIKEYAIFLKMKSKYCNSCFYNYTQKNLSVKSGISLSTVRKYVKIFIDRGWCRLHRVKGKYNLLFTPLKSFDDNKLRLITSLDFGKPIKDILNDLYLIILRNKQNQFDNLKKLGREIHEPKSLESYKKAVKTLKRIKTTKNKLPKGSDQLQISVKNISKMLKCSVGKAHKVLTKLYQNEHISVWPAAMNKLVCSKNSIVLKSALLVDNTFLIGNTVYYKPCNQYNFFE